MNKLGTSKIEWFVSLCSLVSFYTASGGIPAIVSLGIVFTLFLAFAIMHDGRFYIKIDGYHWYLLAFCLFCYSSTIWAQNSTYALTKSNSLLMILMIFSVLHLIFNNNESIRGILKLIQWCNYFVLAYAILRYGRGAFVSVLQNNERISNDYLNANTLGMCAAYAVVINLYFSLYERVKFTDILMIPAVVILAASASKKALMILIAGIFAVFILRSYDNKKLIRSILRVVPVLLILFVVVIFLSRLSIFDHISKRMARLITFLWGEDAGNMSDWHRMEYNKLGLQIFLQNPILGIGLDNARLYTLRLYGYNHYLHNNYAELAACVGIIGIGIYYSIYIHILFIMLKYRSLRDNEWDICMILLLIWLVMDYGYVTYLSRGTYIYLLLFWLESQKLKKRAEFLCQSDRSCQAGAK